MLHLGPVLHDADRLAPAFVGAAVVALHHQLAVAYHDDAMDVGLQPAADEGIEAAQRRGIEADLGRRCDGPAVVQGCGFAAILGGGWKAERDQREQKH